MKNKIIDSLKRSNTYFSGEDLSRQLNISRAAVWKNIEELRKEGYQISAVPHSGYKLESIPDRLYPREIQHKLQTQHIGQSIQYYPSIESTMDEAYEAAREGATEGTVILTEHQTRGRGRLGRKWTSPKEKGIYFSIVLRPKLKPSNVAKLTLLSGVALCEAIAATTDVRTQIKWPNDLLYNGKKVAGILTEMNAEMDRVHFCILGIGVNVNSSAKQLPEEATSLKLITGKSVKRIELVQNIFQSLEYWYDFLQNQDFDPIIRRWKSLSFTLGKKVRIGEVEGEAIDLDEYGALLLRRDDGEIVKQISGDVFHV